MPDQNIRVLLAKKKIDVHGRGSKLIARELRDAGMEVIYLGNTMPEAIVQTAIQEDTDVIGLSTLSGNHMLLAPEVVRLLRKRDAEDIAVVLGGSSSSREYVQRLGRVLRKQGNAQAILYEVIARKTVDEGIARRRRPKSKT